jgi:putative tryptophan/tyrosine transport system substrate-binding protein
MVGIRRREFIVLVGSTATWPTAVRAQQAMPVVGYLNNGSPEENAHLIRSFREGLSQGGFVDSRNVTIESRWANNRNDRLSELANDLVRRQVVVIVAVGDADVAFAAKAATATIPIVFASGFDPVRSGLVASLNRPGGNVTGITGTALEIIGKQLGLLHKLVPEGRRLGILVNSANQQAESISTDARAAALAIGRQVETFAVSSNRDIEAAFVSLIQKQIAALQVTADQLFIVRRTYLAVLAARHAVPVIFPFREDAEAGGLMSYGPNILDTNRQVGIYTSRILKGEKPADLPVMQASKLEFVINLLAARAIGLNIPVELLALADHVIE